MYCSNRGQQKQKKALMKAIMAMVGLCIVGYIIGPPLYWHLSDLLAATLRSSSSSSSSYDCPPCFCDCSSLPLLPQPDGLANSSFTECVKHEAEGNQEMDKGFTELVSEEVKLKEAEALENHHRADMALLEAKKVASQYQKEADKCNSGMETCEEAREKAQAALEAQRKLSAMWELRAHQRGWKQVATTTSRTVAGRKF